jgi:acetylglutamate kinase
VNADAFAGHLAARLHAARLVIAGTTPGVLDAAGTTLDVLDPLAIDLMIDSGSATAGMIVKLHACKHALSHGVGEVVIADGRDRRSLEAAVLGKPPAGATRIVTTAGVDRTS